MLTLFIGALVAWLALGIIVGAASSDPNVIGATATREQIRAWRQPVTMISPSPRSLGENPRSIGGAP